jgi:predicted DNA-binding protein
LDKISKELGEKKSHIVKDALIYYFDYLDTLIAEKRLETLENGESKMIPTEEVWKEAGLE